MDDRTEHFKHKSLLMRFTELDRQPCWLPHGAPPSRYSALQYDCASVFDTPNPSSDRRTCIRLGTILIQALGLRDNRLG
jgi:hypothetical protein